MAVDLQGNIIDEEGKRLGGQVDLSTGQLTTPNTISSDSLASTPSYDFTQAEQTPTTGFPAIDESVYTPTPKENEISNLIKDLTATSGIEGERLSFTAEQEKLRDLEGLQRIEQDYSSQLKQLEADFKNVEERMQVDAEGRGITAGGLAPITASEQRKILIRANTVSALQSAAQGRVAFAQQQVDRAVNLKFAQKEADRKAKLENLQLLLQDPNLSLQQQKRADARTRALNNEVKADEKKKEDAKTILGWALELSKNPLIANQIANIANSDNPDLAKAFALYSANKPQASGFEVPTIKNINGVDMQWDETTGTWKQLPGGTGAVQSPYQAERSYRTLQSVNELLTKAVQNPGIFGRTAAFPLPDFARTDAFRNFESQLDVLKSSIITSELTAMREASKTGGALGNISDRESAFLQNALGALSMKQTPAEFQKQLIKIKDSIQRWQQAVGQYGSPTSGGKTVTAPDGTQVIITD